MSARGTARVFLMKPCTSTMCESATTRTDFRWSGLESGTYSIRVRSVDADGQAGPWSAPSNAVVIR